MACIGLKSDGYLALGAVYGLYLGSASSLICSGGKFSCASTDMEGVES